MKLSKERRQIEIVSLTQHNQKKYSVADLCEEFGVEVATIHRDLSDLRSLGIPIHSIGNKVQLGRKLNEKQIQLLLARYLASVGETIGYPKNISLTVRKLKEKAIDTIVALVNGIGKKQVLKIKYYKMYDDETVERIVEPYELIPTSREWRLIARSEGYFKQFLVENILDVLQTHEKFERKKEFESIDFFRHSFNYWRGEEDFDVTLEFDRTAASVIAAEIWSEDQELESQPNGSVLLKMKINALEQIGDWVMGWGRHVKVIAPPELKQLVVEKARVILRKHRAD